MKHLAARLLTMLFTVALGCALCLVLYYMDNKYTSPGPQGIDGLLVLREADLTEDQIHYLIHGWAFYPDMLFTPAQLQEEGDDRYMTYCAIGEKTNFKTAASDDPHGCGSYVLTLLLPETERIYALELPEIYSAYRLYVNDTLVAQMGDPDEETYTPRTKIETVTFQASGRVTLLLAVRDASHYYSGLVYPPAFGLPGGVTLLRGLSLSLQVSALILSLVCAAMAFFAGYRLQRQDAKLFGILCLFAALTNILQLLHRFIPLPIHPWYAMESFCGHCIILFVVLLQNRICDVERRVAAFFTAAGTLFCFASLLYGLLSSHLTIPVMAVFSGIITLFKLGTALYLLAVAFYALLKKQLKMAPLFYASTLYATLLIWDRLLPQFEPRLAGWFSEWGTLAMIVAIGLSLWRDILAAYARSLAFAEEHRQIERQYAMQMQYANRTAQYIAENRRLLHDVRQHVRTIAELASQVKSQPETAHAQEALMHYLEALPHPLKPGNAIAPGTFSNHAAVDALLQFYQAAAEKRPAGLQHPPGAAAHRFGMVRLAGKSNGKRHRRLPALSRRSAKPLHPGARRGVHLLPQGGKQLRRPLPAHRYPLPLPQTGQRTAGERSGVRAPDRGSPPWYSGHLSPAKDLPGGNYPAPAARCPCSAGGSIKKPPGSSRRAALLEGVHMPFGYPRRFPRHRHMQEKEKEKEEEREKGDILV